MNMVSKSAARIVSVATLTLFLRSGIVQAQNTIEIFKQSLDKSKSKIEFDVESNLVNASGDFSDYVARIELAPKDLSKSSFAFSLNLAYVDIDSGAPQMNFII